MVRSRKQSRRMPARRKFKIARKVREHNRKMRKEAKAKGKSKGGLNIDVFFSIKAKCTEFVLPSCNIGLKKDPGIPNLFPFKEQLLKQMEERKQRSADERERQKLHRNKVEKQKRRSLQGLKNDALKRTKEFEKKVRRGYISFFLDI